MESVIILTTGQPGSGKSYSRVRFLVEDFLLNDTGLYITNLPLKIDEICYYLSQKTSKPFDFYHKRIILIDNTVLDKWYNLQNCSKDILQSYRENKNFPPSVYFSSFDLTNSRIVLDEFHLYFSKTHPPLLRELWNTWFAEVRKCGCCFEAVTQDMSLLPREFIGKVGRRIDLIPVSSTRDPFFGISMGDWYELRAGFFGVNQQKISETEYRKGTSFTGSVKWVVCRSLKFVISPDIYRFYNSYQRNDNQSVGKYISPSSRLGRRVVFWFLRRNFFSIFSRFVVVVVFIWLCFFGGILFLINGFVDSLTSMANSNRDVAVQPSSDNSVAVQSSSDNSVAVQSSSDNSVAVQSSSDNSVAVQPSSDNSVASPPSSITSDFFNYKPCMFFDGFCYLRNGLRVFIGYRFEDGPFIGLEVSYVDSVERFVKLSNGTYLRMF